MRTRARDLLGADATPTLLDASTGRTDLAAFFDRETTTVRRDHSGEPVPTDQVLLVTLGPDARAHGSVAESDAALRRVGTGGRALVLLGWAPGDLGSAGVAVRLARLGFVAVRTAPTPYPQLPVAVVVERRTEAAADGAPDDDDHARAAEAIQGELTLAAAEWLADEVATLTTRLTGRGAATDPVLRVAELTRERGQLSANLRKAEADLAAAREALDMMERSAAMRVGKVLVDAAKNPRTATKLPRQAVRMWRIRGGRAGLAQARAKAEAAEESPVSVVDVDRLVAWRSVSLEPRTRMSVLGVLRPETETVLSSAAFVDAAKPDDLVALLDRSDPDVVLLETAVSGPSSPWAYLGNAAAAEREARLLGLLDEAQGSGRPVVLWRNTPVHETAALGAFAARCDLVVDSAPARSGGIAWSVGVALAQAVALDDDPAARTDVLHAGGHDRRDSARRRAILVEALVAGGDRTVVRTTPAGPGAEGLPDAIPVGRRLRRGEYAVACRRAAVVLASPFVVPGSMLGLRDEDLVALAAGARLVSGPNRDLAALERLGGAVVVAAEGDVAGAVRAAVEAGPLSAAEHLQVLRTIFLEHSVPARLAQLTSRLGLDVVTDVHRRAALVVEPGTTVDPAELVEAVLAQQVRPAEVVLADRDLAGPRSLDELRAVGVAVRIVPSADAGLVDLARAVDSTWLLTWASGPDGAWSSTHLLDLLVGAEAGSAEAVGLAREGGVRVTTELPPGSVLLRRSTVVDDAQDGVDLPGWSRRGRTLVTVGSGATA